MGEEEGDEAHHRGSLLMEVAGATCDLRPAIYLLSNPAAVPGVGSAQMGHRHTGESLGEGGKGIRDHHHREAPYQALPSVHKGLNGPREGELVCGFFLCRRQGKGDRHGALGGGEALPAVYFPRSHAPF